MAYVEGFTDEDYTVLVDVALNSGADAELWVRSTDPENGYVLSLEADGDVFLYKYAAGSRSTLDSDTYTPAASVSVRLVVDGTDIDAYIDASHKIDTSDSTHAAGGVAFAGQQPKFDDLAIGHDDNADGDLNDGHDTKPVAMPVRSPGVVGWASGLG